jgi:hypothetical protein
MWEHQERSGKDGPCCFGSFFDFRSLTELALNVGASEASKGVSDPRLKERGGGEEGGMVEVG